MKKIHKYITKNFSVTFFISLVFVSLLFVLSDFFGNLSLILKNSVPIKYIAEYYIYFLPFIIYLSLPFVFALSSLVSLGFLSMRNEIIVMRSSGLSIFNIAYPIIIMSIITAGVMFIGKEKVVNYGLQRASFIKHYYFKNKQFDVKWIKIGNYFVNILSMDIKNKTAKNVIVYEVNKDFDGVSKIFECDEFKILKKKAIFKDCVLTSVPFQNKSFIKEKVVNFKGNFYSLLSLSEFKEPSIFDIIRKIKKSKDRNYYLSMMIFRVLYPLSCLILTLLSFVFVLRVTPRKSGFIKNVFIGGIVFLIYIGSFEMVSSMGKYSMIDPVLSMITFILFWLAVSLYNLLKLGI